MITIIFAALGVWIAIVFYDLCKQIRKYESQKHSEKGRDNNA